MDHKEEEEERGSRSRALDGRRQSIDRLAKQESLRDSA